MFTRAPKGHISRRILLCSSRAQDKGDFSTMRFGSILLLMWYFEALCTYLPCEVSDAEHPLSVIDFAARVLTHAMARKGLLGLACLYDEPYDVPLGSKYQYDEDSGSLYMELVT